MRLAAALIALACATSAQAEVTGARYAEPTDRYRHAVLGDAIEYGALVIERRGAPDVRIVLPERRVFEDTAPRIHDLDGDGLAEVIAVESDRELGARLAVYGPSGLIAAGPFIGQPFRWLAPVGAADLDGDGRTEIAYVDRPHLAKVLTVYRYADGGLTLVGTYPGVTNHRIGEDFISGGIRDCGDGPEMVLADAGWRRVIALGLSSDARFDARDLGAFRGPESFNLALDCRAAS